MDESQERQLNQAAFRRLSALIKLTYPAGRFLAISGGQVVGVADRLEELRSMLVGMGKDPTRVLVVRTGVDYPESAVIFFQGTRR